jgi:hypothetical protein
LSGCDPGDRRIDCWTRDAVEPLQTTSIGLIAEGQQVCPGVVTTGLVNLGSLAVFHLAVSHRGQGYLDTLWRLSAPRCEHTALDQIVEGQLSRPAAIRSALAGADKLSDSGMFGKLVR